MITILADHHLEGLAEHLERILAADGWLELAAIRFVTLSEAGLANESSDRAVWRLAQAEQMVLLTANRNMKGNNSLEATLREEITASSLPVITMSSIRHLGVHEYRERCAARLLEILLDLDRYIGTPRLFIP